MPAPQVLTALVEVAVNTALSWSSNSAELLEPLADKTCIIYLQELDTALIFRFSLDGLTVGADVDKLYSEIPDDEGTAALNDNECWVSVSLFAVDKLKQNNQMTKLIKSGQLDFSGDLGILQAVSRLFEKLDIDFEEVLSGYVGDATAYQLNTSGKKMASTLKTNFELFSQTLADAALDEKPIGVRPIMVMNFCDEVNLARADADRLQAKLDKLETTLKNKIQTGKSQ